MVYWDHQFIGIFAVDKSAVGTIQVYPNDATESKSLDFSPHCTSIDYTDSDLSSHHSV